MKKLFKVSLNLLATAMMLTSCQRGADYKSTTYQNKTTEVIAASVKKVSAPIESVRSNGSRSAVRGIGNFNGYDFFGNAPYQGQYFSNTMTGVADQCLSILEYMGNSMTDEAFLSEVIRCTNTMASYQNPAFSLASQHLNGAGRTGWEYLLAYSLPGQTWGGFNQYQSQYMPYYNQWSQYGFTGDAIR